MIDLSKFPTYSATNHRDGQWVVFRGPKVTSLYVAVHIGKKLKTATVYMPNDGRAPYAAFNGTHPSLDDVNNVPGSSVEELMAWCEEKMGLKAPN